MTMVTALNHVGGVDSILAEFLLSAPRATGERDRGITRPGGLMKIDSGGMSRVTTQLAPTIDLSPIMTPPSTQAPE